MFVAFGLELLTITVLLFGLFDLWTVCGGLIVTAITEKNSV